MGRTDCPNNNGGYSKHNHPHPQPSWLLLDYDECNNIALKGNHRPSLESLDIDPEKHAHDDSAAY